MKIPLRQPADRNDSYYFEHPKSATIIPDRGFPTYPLRKFRTFRKGFYVPLTKSSSFFLALEESGIQRKDYPKGRADFSV